MDGTRLRRAVKAAAVGCAALLACAGLSVAATRDSSPVYHGCVGPSGLPPRPAFAVARRTLSPFAFLLALLKRGLARGRLGSAEIDSG